MLGLYSYGDYSNKICRLEGPDETHFFNVSEDSKIESVAELDENSITFVKENLSRALGEIEEVQIIVVSGLNIGDDVPNWNEYTEIQI